MAMQWFYQQGDKAFGPFDRKRMRRMLEAGKLGPATPVRRGSGDWIPFGSVPELTSETEPKLAAMSSTSEMPVTRPNETPPAVIDVPTPRSAFVKNNLAPGELFVTERKPSWSVHVIGVFFLINSAIPNYNDYARAACLAVGVIAGVVMLVFQSKTVYAVSNKRVFFRRWKSSQPISLRISSVGELQAYQSIPGQIFGFGTIAIRLPNESQILFRCVPNPLGFRDAIEHSRDSVSDWQDSLIARERGKPFQQR